MPHRRLHGRSGSHQTGPGTTHFAFSDELHARIAALPNVGAVKIPGVPTDRAPDRIAALRRLLPDGIALGVSGDPLAAGGLNAGSEAWFSVLGGLMPEPCLAITRAATGGRHDEATALSDRLHPLWTLFHRYGSLRVVSAAAEHLGLVAYSEERDGVEGIAAKASRPARNSAMI